MDNRRYIVELFKIVSVNSILVIDKNGHLTRIYCPFRARVVIPVGIYEKGMIVLVEAVKMTEDLRDVFVIGGKAYFLKYFRILIYE
jgi:hypothetical protein